MVALNNRQRNGRKEYRRSDVIAVLRWSDDQVVYVGSSIGQAAMDLTPGMVYGIGANRDEAIDQAKRYSMNYRLALKHAESR